MSFVKAVLRRFEHARQHVPRWARMLVVGIAVALTLGTWVHLPLMAIGLDVPGWEAFVLDMCDPFCHQLPSRSFHLAGHALPLCARCSGMWLGITLGVAFAMIAVPRHRWWTGVLLAVLATAASGFDFLREESGGSPNAWVRATLGFWLFIGVTLAVSFDALAVLSAVGRFVRRLHRGESGP